MLKGFSRSFKYSVYQGSRYAVTAIGATVVYSIYMALLNESFSIVDVLTTYPLQLAFLTAFISMINGLVNAATVVPEQISFGCLRKHAAMSYGCGYLITTAEILVVLCVYYGGMLVLAPAMITPVECGKNLLLFVGLMLAASGLTAIMAMLIMQFGRVVYLIFVICISVCVGGFTAYLLMEVTGRISIDTRLLAFLFAVGSVVLFGLGNAVLIWYSKKIEVKA